MTLEAINDLHHKLAAAYHSGAWVPFDDTVSTWPVAEIYDVQEELMDRLFAAWGDTAAGYKISATADSDQALINSTEPTYGRFATQRVLTDGATIDTATENALLLEPELVLRPTVDLTSSMSVDDLADAVEVTGGIEVPTSRYRDWVPTPAHCPLTISSLVLDNAVAGYLVVGEEWTTLDSAQYAEVTTTLLRDGATLVAGEAARVMGSPLNSLAWLVRDLERRGQSLPAGTLVSSGTFTPPQLGVPGAYAVTFSHGIAGPGLTLR